MINIAKLIITAAFLLGLFLVSLGQAHVNWMYFMALAVMGVASILVLKRVKKSATKDEALLANDKKIMLTSLNNIVSNLQALEGRKDKVLANDMRFEIDRTFRNDLNNFAGSRDSLKHMFGLMAYADIMSSFTAGERYLNRVWSAPTEGYVDDVLEYISQALNQFEDVVAEWDKVHTTSL